MKKAFFALCLLVSASGYSQTKSDGPVPKELLTNDSTYWTISTVSTVNYVNTSSGPYYGTTVNGGGMIAKFKFLPNNRFRFQLYVQANSYNIRSETWTDVEGSVVFTKDAKGQNIFITQAQKGLYRINNNGKVTQRPITETELKGTHSTSYLWEKSMMKDDSKNVYLLVVDLNKHPQADVNTPGSIDPSWVSKFHIPIND